jgi:hypothetical protein
VFTVEEAARYKGDLPGAHTKNLFLRDKPGKRMWLVCVLAERDVDLQALPPRIGAKPRLSFGSEERMMRYLGITPGAVSPFAIINDHDGHVQVVLDRALLTGDVVNLHPSTTRRPRRSRRRTCSAFWRPNGILHSCWTSDQSRNGFFSFGAPRGRSASSIRCSSGMETSNGSRS